MKIDSETLAIILRNSNLRLKIVSRQSNESSEVMVMIINCKTKKYDIVSNQEDLSEYKTIITDIGKKKMMELRSQLNINGFIWTQRDS